jgi:hypothetical protein
MNFYTVYQKTKKIKKNKKSEIPFSAEEQRLGTFQANPSLLYASDMSLRFVITRQMELTMEVLRPAAKCTNNVLSRTDNYFIKSLIFTLGPFYKKIYIFY